MKRVTRFCADCGELGVPLQDSFCQNCFWKVNSLSIVKKTAFEIPYCLTCYSAKLTNGWVKTATDGEFKDQIAISLRSEISFNFETRLSVDSITDVNWDIPKPELTIKYVLTSSEIEIFEERSEKIEFFVLLAGGICKSCITRKTGNRDVTVQFRAKNRKIDPEEDKFAGQLAVEAVKMYDNEVVDAYLSDVIDNHGGLDFYFGNSEVADIFVEKLKNNWIGHSEVNYTLQTEEKDGRRVYRKTHLFRLPEPRKKDYVIYQEELHQTLAIARTAVRLVNLRTHKVINSRDWDTIIMPDPLPTLTEWLVISEDYSAKTYQLMHNESYETIDIEKSELPEELPIGENVKFICLNDELFLPTKLIVA
ncbi:MAG: hypothetical protein IH840_05615 [Candidatus Heimdallarchaeota archaeon]|nr:hypothetical protein [Candidatus Heimdallarchaeota archaeon]